VDSVMLYSEKHEPAPFRRSHERFEDMPNPLIQFHFDSNAFRLGLFAAVFALVLGVTGWEPCEAQQIPRRLDTSVYQNRGPTPPLLSPRGPLFIQPDVSPYTGQRIKTYYKPTARQLWSAPAPFFQGPAGWTPGGRQLQEQPPPSLQGPTGWTPGGAQRRTGPRPQLE
jgi:hypothetical protein